LVSSPVKTPEVCSFNISKGAGDLRETGTFAFYIKARKATPSEEPNGLYVPTSRSSGLISPGRLATAREKHNYHILLVEDNLINQKVLSKQLRSAGCTVHVAVCFPPSSHLGLHSPPFLL
jgi:hypothetical protein